MTPKDQWIIDKFNGVTYEATAEGILISHNAYKTAKRGPMKTLVHRKTGYVMVSLWDKDAQKMMSCLVHRIIALVHHVNPFDLRFVNHIDGIKANCGKDNLEWSSMSWNQIHAYRMGLRDSTGSANPRAKLSERDIPLIRDRIACGESMTSIGSDFCVSPATIGDIKTGKSWGHV